MAGAHARNRNLEMGGRKTTDEIADLRVDRATRLQVLLSVVPRSGGQTGSQKSKANAAETAAATPPGPLAQRLEGGLTIDRG